jgi:hypothetical protein
MLELMFQHVQFRRIEKFYRNYFDAGRVVEEIQTPEYDKIVQALEYLDGTIFKGEMECDEESLLKFKEGIGYILRPKDSNFSYYQSIKGNWVRGMMHGKRNELVLNMKVFPKGYY